MMMAQNNNYPSAQHAAAQGNNTPEVPQSPIGNFPVDLGMNVS